MRMFASVFGLLLCSLMMAAPARAQAPHAASPVAIDDALQEHVAAGEADRAVVQRLLERPDVQAIAQDIGLDVRRAQSAAATLEGEDLARIAAQAREAERGLAGGQSNVTISTTMIIIGLLVLILLILVLR